MNKRQLQERYGRHWRELLLLEAQTVALVGCEKPRCMINNPPEPCSSCNSLIIKLLLMRG